MATTPRQPASLFTIPAELRNEIYNYAAIDHEPINAGIAFTSEKFFHEDLKSQPPPLAAVCKQLREEVLQIYYSKNKVVLGDDICQIDPCLCSGNVYGWRPLASVLRLIREEVLPLSLSLSLNDFTIGDANPSADRYWTGEAWRRQLGDNAQKLRDVTLVTRSLHRATRAYGEWYINGCLAMRATFREDGSLLFGHAAHNTCFCACDLRKAAGDTRGFRKDGRRLLKILEDSVGRKVFCLREWEVTACGYCGLHRLGSETEHRRSFVGEVIGWVMTFYSVRNYKEMDDVFGLSQASGTCDKA